VNTAAQHNVPPVAEPEPGSRHGRRRHRRHGGGGGGPDRRRHGRTDDARRTEGGASVRWPAGSAGWLGLVIEVLFVAVLAFAPLAYGSVEPWAAHVVTCGAAAIALVAAIRFAVAPGPCRLWDWAYLPAGLFVALVAFQLVPLPAGLVGLLSPNTAALRAELLGPGGVAGPLSLYPDATARDLRVVLAAVAMYLAAAQTFRRPEQVRRVLIALAAIGFGTAALALAQDATGATQVYWVGATNKYNTATAGPFVHYSHYGQFANLTAGAALGLLLVVLHERAGGRRRHGGGGRGGGAWSTAAVVWAAGLALTLLLSATAVLLSGSRTAMSAMVPAALFAAVCVARSRAFGGHGWAAVPVLAALVGLLLAAGSGAALERWGTLRSADTYAIRLQILSDMRPMVARFPVLGTGLGTHETTFAMFDRSDRPDTATHAENEYAQVLGETGAVGLALVLAFAGLTLVGLLRAARRGRPPIRLAAIGIGAGLVATAVHSLADFGQHLPANAVMAATLCGLSVSLRRLRDDQDRPETSAAADAPADAAATTAAAGDRRPGSLPHPALRCAAVIAVAIAGTWAVVGGARAASAAGPADAAQQLQAALSAATEETTGTNDDYAQALGLAEQAARSAPGNVRHRYLLGALRWQSISRVRDPETGDVVLTPASRDHAARIEADLRDARRLCPTFGPLYSLGGQIRLFVLRDPAGAGDLRTAFRLSNTDSLAMLLCARLDLDAGDVPAAEAKLHRFLALTNDFGRVLQATVPGGHRAVAARLAAGSYDRLAALAGELDGPQGDPAAAAAARRDAAAALAAEVAAPNAPATRLVEYAKLAAAGGDRDAAIGAYQRAVRQDYGQPDWQLALAQLLAEAGRREEAARAARACLLVRPNDPAATELAEQMETPAAAATRPGGPLE